MFLAFLNRLALAAFSQVVDAAQAALVEAVVDAFLTWFKAKTETNAAAVRSSVENWAKATTASPLWDPSAAVAAALLNRVGSAPSAPNP